MERSKAAVACLLLVLLVVTATAAGALPTRTTAAARPVVKTALLEDAVVVLLQAEAPLLAAATTSGSFSIVDVDDMLHRRVLVNGGYINPSVLPGPRCIGSCPVRGGAYTGRGNNCKYQNAGGSC
ncbi:hypothetical protein ABZP36_003959 [Zizania latifolia]